MNLLWLKIPLVPEQRCLEYQYTKLGKQTYSSQWSTSVPEWRWLANHYTKLGRCTYFHWWNPPGYQSRDDLQTTTQNLADEPTLANGSPSTKAEMTSIQYNKLGRQTYSNQWNLSVLEQRWLAYHYTKPSRWIYFGKRTPPQYESRDDLHTTYTKLGRWTYTGQWTQPAILLLQTCQMNLLWQMDPFWILQENVGISSYFWIIRVVNSQLALYSVVRFNSLDTTQNIPRTPLETPHKWQ